MIILFMFKGGNLIPKSILLCWMIIQITNNSFQPFFLRTVLHLVAHLPGHINIGALPYILLFVCFVLLADTYNKDICFNVGDVGYVVCHSDFSSLEIY